VAGSTGLAEIVYRLTESTRLSMLFLGGVLVSAYLLGSGPAYFAAGLAFLIYDFYLVEPRFTITFSTSDLITLVVFLAVAMLTGRLTGRVKDAAKRAEVRARTTEALFDATRAFSPPTKALSATSWPGI
jgi:two-component system sensor histidine kinase KdpD